MGADAIKDLLLREGVEEEQARLREVIATSKGQKQQRAIKRLRVVSAFIGRPQLAARDGARRASR